MTRIPLVENKQSLGPEHHGIYDAIVKSRGEVRGCFPALLQVPTIADHTASLGGYLRFDGKLEPKVRTLAALTASRELDCIHEWAAGVKNAEKNRISRETLVAVHQRQPTTGLPPDEAEIVDYVRALLHSPSRHRAGFSIDARPLRRRRHRRTHGNHRLLFDDLLYAQCFRTFILAQSGRIPDMTDH